MLSSIWELTLIACIGPQLAQLYQESPDEEEEMISKATSYGCFPEVGEVAARQGEKKKKTWEFEEKVGSEPWHSHCARER